MNKQTLLILFTAFLIQSCESEQEQMTQTLLPETASETIIDGVSTRRIMADFHYVEGSRLIDRIVWSNHQTHFFEYGEKDRLLVVRKVKVQEKLQDEYWFEYQEERMIRANIIRKNLDYFCLLPLDSSYVGYLDYQYEEGRVAEERRHGFDQEGNQVLEQKRTFSYDPEGNIIRRVTTSYGEPESTLSEEMSYDKGLHPFSGLHYYFTGNSHRNNVVSLTTSHDNTCYQYELEANSDGYPEIIFESLGAYHSRVLRYTYLTP